VHVETERVEPESELEAARAQADDTVAVLDLVLDLSGHRVDADGVRRPVVEAAAPADPDPDHVVRHEVHLQPFAVQSRLEAAVGLADLVDPLEAQVVVGGDHR
jgi:hypothetical protein